MRRRDQRSVVDVAARTSAALATSPFEMPRSFLLVGKPVFVYQIEQTRHRHRSSTTFFTQRLAVLDSGNPLRRWGCRSHNSPTSLGH